jgi:hypothetical protein
MSHGKTFLSGVLLASWLISTPAVRADDSRSVIDQCPGYADHLRVARAYLERSDRANALVELKQARELLRVCEETQATETALAARASANRAI